MWSLRAVVEAEQTFRTKHFSNRPSKTRLPRTDEEKASPLHVKGGTELAGKLNVDSILEMAVTEVKERLMHLFDIINFPSSFIDYNSKMQCPIKSSLSSEHAEILVQNGIIAKAGKRKAMCFGVPFTVY